jgi:hypothetical protein
VLALNLLAARLGQALICCLLMHAWIGRESQLHVHTPLQYFTCFLLRLNGRQAHRAFAHAVYACAPVQGAPTGFQLTAPSLPLSSASSFAMSSASSSKSYSAVFEWMRDGVADLGSGTYLPARQPLSRARLEGVKTGGRTHPFCSDQRRRTCAGSRWCFFASAVNTSLSNEPRRIGQYASTTMLCFSQ